MYLLVFGLFDSSILKNLFLTDYSIRPIIVSVGREGFDWIVHSKTDTWDYSIHYTWCKWWCIIAQFDLAAIDHFLFRSRGHERHDADGPLYPLSSSSTKSDPELETRFIVYDLTAVCCGFIRRCEEASIVNWRLTCDLPTLFFPRWEHKDSSLKG